MVPAACQGAALQVLFAPDDPTVSLELSHIERVRQAFAKNGKTYLEGQNPYRTSRRVSSTLRTPRVVLSGSMNPNQSAGANDETLHQIRDPGLVARYTRAYEAVLAGQGLANSWDAAAAVNVLFTPAASGPRAGSKILSWLAAEQEQILLMTDLLRRYDPAFEASAWSRVTVRFAVKHAGTAWGDELAIVGELPQLGVWKPAQGLALSGSSWPLWQGAVQLPAGVRPQYKAVTRHAGGQVSWQAGANRHLEVPTNAAAAQVSFTY